MKYFKIIYIIYALTRLSHKDIRSDFSKKLPISTNESESRKEIKEFKKEHNFLGVAGFLAILYAIFSLFGFGVFLELTTKFGHEPGSMITSPMDLLIASWKGIFIILLTITKIDLTFIVSKIPIFFFLISFIFALLIKYCKMPKSLRIDIYEAITGESRNLLALLALLAPFILSILFYFVIFFASAAIAIIPVIGFYSADRYASEYVINPEYCATSKSRQQRLSKQSPTNDSPQGAACVLISSTDPQKTFEHKARMVITTPSYALTFEPISGTSSRIPISDKLITQINTLD